MRRTRVQGREVRVRTGEGKRRGEEAKKNKKSYRRDEKNGGYEGGRRKKRKWENAGSAGVDTGYM